MDQKKKENNKAENNKLDKGKIDTLFKQSLSSVAMATLFPTILELMGIPLPKLLLGLCFLVNLVSMPCLAFTCVLKLSDKKSKK